MPLITHPVLPLSPFAYSTADIGKLRELGQVVLGRSVVVEDDKATDTYVRDPITNILCKHIVMMIAIDEKEVYRPLPGIGATVSSYPLHVKIVLILDPPRVLYIQCNNTGSPVSSAKAMNRASPHDANVDKDGTADVAECPG